MLLAVWENICSVSFLCILYFYFLITNTPDIEVVKVEKVKRDENKADSNNDKRYALDMAVLDLVQNREGGEVSNGFKKKVWLSILTSFKFLNSYFDKRNQISSGKCASHRKLRHKRYFVCPLQQSRLVYLLGKHHQFVSTWVKMKMFLLATERDHVILHVILLSFLPKNATKGVS